MQHNKYIESTKSHASIKKNTKKNPSVTDPTEASVINLVREQVEQKIVGRQRNLGLSLIITMTLQHSPVLCILTQ